MTKRCSVCEHSDRARIELARVAGQSLDEIAEKFQVGRDAVWRHCTKHLTPAARAQLIADIPIKQAAERAAEEGVSLLDYFGLMRAILLNAFRTAAAEGDAYKTVSLSGRLTEVLREIGRLSGEIRRASPVNVTNNIVSFVNSPVFADLPRMLVRRLAGHPAALASVVDGLRELESQGASPAPLALPGGAVVVDVNPVEATA